MELLMKGLDLSRQLYVERAQKCAHAFLQMSEEDQKPGRVWDFVDYPMRVSVDWTGTKQLAINVTMLEADMKTEVPEKRDATAQKPARPAAKKRTTKKKTPTVKPKPVAKKKAKAKVKRRR